MINVAQDTSLYYCNPKILIIYRNVYVNINKCNLFHKDQVDRTYSKEQKCSGLALHILVQILRHNSVQFASIAECHATVQRGSGHAAVNKML